MEPEYARSYRDLYSDHWWWRAREKFILSILQNLASESGFGQILDVGCGDGLFFEELKKFGIPEGVEPDHSIVTDFGRSLGLIHIGEFNAEFNPGHSFGLILMLDVLEHLADPVAALRHAKSLLTPAGLVVVTVPAFHSLWTAHDDYNHHLRRYRRSTLAMEIHDSGLDIELIRYYFHWMFPIKFLMAKSEQIRSKRPLPARVPPKIANSLCYFVSRLEQRLTRRIPFPFGNSLIAVLR